MKNKVNWKGVYEVKNINTLKSELNLDAFALLRYFGEEGKIQEFSKRRSECFRQR